MSRFGADPRAFFNSVYGDTAPWDVGGPQPALAALFDALPPASPILDVGCGSGDLAIGMAERGLEVLGIDFAEKAIAQAQAKIASLPVAVAGRINFQVADGLQPSSLGRKFGAVVDSGFYHLFDPEPCARFVDDLPAALLPGGRYYLLAFAHEYPIPNAPRRVSREEVEARFTPEKGWKILHLQSAEFLSRFAPTPATCACIEYGSD